MDQTGDSKMTHIASQLALTRHARQRCQQRGVRASLLRSVLENADVENPAHNGAVLVSVSKDRAEKLNIDDRLSHLGVVLANDGAVITVAHISGNRRGKAWRRGRR
jgi:anti-sigma factor RsiW